MFASNDFDLVIIGAGVVGALCAREAARRSLRTLVIDAAPDIAMGATKANSGIVHGAYAEGPDTLKGRLCAKGRVMFAELEDELNFGFRACGSLVLAGDGDESRLHLQKLLQQGLKNGVTDLELIDRQQLRELEPAISPELSQALWCKGAGVCSPWDLTHAALEQAIGMGVQLRLSCSLRSARLERDADSAWLLGLHSRRGGLSSQVRSTWVINASGLACASLDRLAGLDPIPCTARNGQYLIFARDSASSINRVLFQLPGPMGKGVLVTPTYHNNLLIGPDAKNLSAAENPALLLASDAERLKAILGSAQRLLPGLSAAKAIRSFTGVRSAAADGDFHIGLADPHTAPRWLHALGVQSPGLTASPAIALMLLDEITGVGENAASAFVFKSQSPPLPRRMPLPSHRSRRAPPLAAAALQAAVARPVGDPTRVVCRCEQVSEADLLEVLTRQPQPATLDAIKRRSRAGMGWCQGEFCRPRVLECAERMLGHPFDEAARLTDTQRLKVSRIEAKDLRSL